MEFRKFSNSEVTQSQFGQQNVELTKTVSALPSSLIRLEVGALFAVAGADAVLPAAVVVVVVVVVGATVLDAPTWPPGVEPRSKSMSVVDPNMSAVAGCCDWTELNGVGAGVGLFTPGCEVAEVGVGPGVGTDSGVPAGAPPRPLWPAFLDIFRSSEENSSSSASTPCNRVGGERAAGAAADEDGASKSRRSPVADAAPLVGEPRSSSNANFPVCAHSK